jgi:hypothetical protein
LEPDGIQATVQEMVMAMELATEAPETALGAVMARELEAVQVLVNKESHNLLRLLRFVKHPLEKRWIVLLVPAKSALAVKKIVI